MKSSYSAHRSFSPQAIAEWTIVAMIVGLFLSRALLSVSIGVFFLLAPIRLGFRTWLTMAIRDRLVWILGSLWLLPVISGLWSEDLNAWSDVIRIKLPLLLLPMGWVGLSLNRSSYQRIGWTLTILTCIGAIISVAPMLWDGLSVQRDYLRGGSLITPLENDRVRFSWLIVALLFWMETQWRSASGRGRWLIGILAFLFMLYLHVLAVRIGLLCFYLLAFFWIVRIFSTPSMRKWILPVFILLISLPLLMYQILPTFRARVDYIRYDWSYTFSGKYLPGGNDAIRMQSLQASKHVIDEHSVYGVGFGDIRSKMDSAYQKIDPNRSAADRIYPANEWAVYGVGMGWIGIIAFSGLMIWLFFYTSIDPFRWRSWVLATILSFVTDIGLEVQYGVFLVPILLLFFHSSDRIKKQEIRS
jgi:hypothetical protein